MDGRVGAENRISNYRLPSIQPERRISAILTFNGIFFSLPNEFLLVGCFEPKNSLERVEGGENLGTVESARLIFNLADEKLISSPEKVNCSSENCRFSNHKVISRNCPGEHRQRKFICYEVSSSKKLYRWAKFRTTSLRRQFYWPPDRGREKGQMYARQRASV